MKDVNIKCFNTVVWLNRWRGNNSLQQRKDLHALLGEKKTKQNIYIISLLKHQGIVLIETLKYKHFSMGSGFTLTSVG